MANPGAGNKFVSVNLNKSYGHSHHSHHQSNSFAANRTRVGTHGNGGMVMLSRPRSSQKVGSKLSVPPPLNLPSLRKEHEKYDPFGSGCGGSGSGVLGGGPRPTSSGIGWTKQGTVPLQKKDGVDDHTIDGKEQRLLSADEVSKGGNFYMPPARLGASAAPVSASPPAYQPVGKASVLRGEDFPSLQAALPTPSGPPQKQKGGLNQKQNQMVDQESSDVHKKFTGLSSLDMRSQLHLSSRNLGDGFNKSGTSRSFGNSRTSEDAWKQEEFFPDPLPLVRFSPRSNWADDERDTSHGFTDRVRDHVIPKTAAYWERDFDMPRISVLPNKPASLNERRGMRDNNGTVKVSSGEVPKMDSYRRDARSPNKEGREGNMWRAPSFTKDGFGAQEIGNDRSPISSRPSDLSREMSKENRYSASPFRGTALNDFGKSDMGYGQGSRQSWNNSMDTFNSRGHENNIEQYNRYKGDSFQNTLSSKSSFSSCVKGLSVSDPTIGFIREKRQFSKNEKSHLEDPYIKDIGPIGFDGRDPFSGGLVGIVKKKKDVLKQTDFHDPVRESFEAELERVQKMQEQERQRIIEEQERALELAQKEEDERMRLVREHEERERRLEEEAREAAWRAEHEQMEAIRKADEQRIAREEEKQRMLMEEERRKQAAKQKLLELEEKIAKRRAEGSAGDSHSSAAVDEKMPGTVKEKDVSSVGDGGDWEDGERMVERITASASSDSSSVNRQFEVGTIRFSRDGPSTYNDLGKQVNPWRREVFENGNGSTFLLQDHESSNRRDISTGGRPFSRKELYGGAGFTSSKTYRSEVPDPDEFAHLKAQKWNLPSEGDNYSRSMEADSEFHENFNENFGDVGWGQGRHQSNSYTQYPQKLYQHSDLDELYSFGRSRYSMRQPRVLPPPSLSSMQKNYRGEDERPGPSIMPSNNTGSAEPSMQRGYVSRHRVPLELSEVVGTRQEKSESEEHTNTTPRCDSQSSLCVSSAPSSPTHLSHDDVDESRQSPMLAAARDTKGISQLGSEPVTSPTIPGDGNVDTASILVAVGDDEEWSIENNDQFQEQEEYDEDEDGYEEEEEVNEGDNENIGVTREFDEMHLEEKGTQYMMENLVLGFNEGVEVGMPNDEFERSLGNEEGIFLHEVSVHSLEEQRSFGMVGNAGQSLQCADGSPLVSSTSRTFQETEKEMQDLMFKPNNAPHKASVSKLLDKVDTSNSSGLFAQNPVPASVSMASHSSSAQIAGYQTEVPVKLQFGLFSGPSLIPSPVPAIQIGSIQMPLHVHPRGGASLAHLHPSQPLFQFGQLRYTPPMSQGMLPLAAHSMSSSPPKLQANISLKQNAGDPLPVQSSEDTSGNNFTRNDIKFLSVDNQTVFSPRCTDLSQGNVLKEGNSLPATGGVQNMVVKQPDQAETSGLRDKNILSESGYLPETERNHIPVVKKYKSLERRAEPQSQTSTAFSQSVSKEKDINGYKTRGPGGRGKKYVYNIRNNGSRPPYTDPVASHQDSSGFQRRPRRNNQRTEFRVRENADNRQSMDLVYRSNINGRRTGNSARNGTRKVVMSNRLPERTLESQFSVSGAGNSRETNSGSRQEMGAGKETLMRIQNNPRSGEGNLKRNVHSKDDTDAPLQTGIVRVFEQPGIEAPGDEDDFIEVRSKRQMLNDRREQKEKEIKAKSRVTKMLRKPRAISQTDIISASLNEVTVQVGGEAVNSLPSDFGANEELGLAKSEISTRFNTATVPQPLAPIGTPSVRNGGKGDKKSQTINPVQTRSLPVVTAGGKTTLMFESKNQAPDTVQSSFDSWGNSRINRQVMALTQTQFDEAMRPAQFDSLPSVDHISSFSEPSMPSSSILTKDKSSSSVSPINSLLAGEKIQFGAVTSPSILLHPNSHSVSHGIGPPGPSRPDMKISHDLSAPEKDCTLYFGKEKISNESCTRLEVCEDEAEAAASAIAVAAISADEVVANGRGTAISESKSFTGVDVDGITSGVAGDQKLASQSRAEEYLTVALPADLSVENPPISLWPPLPSPQNSSTQMISHFPGRPHHIPFYEMNPVLGAPIFAFGPHDECTTHSDSQKSNTTSGSGPVGTWQQCNSGVDSFYGPPAGFTGPFIGPPGGVQGVQGSPHMVVYNHFAPVGQFGQVGLSFMGTTYIPSGKQPDWKHNPSSSATGVGEGDVNSMNMASVPRNHPNVPATVQHLAPGSPLLSIASPLAVFDVSPFQNSSDVSVQARWSHILPLQSVPLSMPLQQQGGILSSHLNHGSPAEQSASAANRFSESQISTPSEGSQHFPVTTSAAITQLPEVLGLVDHSSPSNTGALSEAVVIKSLPLSAVADCVTSSAVQNCSSASGHNISSVSRSQSSQQKNVSAHYGQASGYTYHRGRVSQKNNQGGEWSHRRMGSQGRNHPLGSEKGPSTKMKQIYVAKQNTSGTS